MKRNVFHIVLVLLYMGFIHLDANDGLGANFPEKPVKIVANFPAGSVIDVEARGIAPYLQKYLGVRVMVENIPGADGKIGLTKIWKSNPDGYNIIYHTTTMSIMVESLSNPEYRITDLAHIFGLTRTNQVLVVNSEKWKTFDEFLNAGKKTILNASLAGRGSTSHLNGLLLADGAGIKVNWVPFSGGADALIAVTGKHVDFAIVPTTLALPLVKAGRLTPLVVLAGKRDEVFPNVKITKELGYDFTVMPPIRGVDGPPKMESAITNRLEDAFFKAAKDPGFLAWAQNKMIEIISMGKEEYGEEIKRERNEIEKYKDILKAEK